MTAPTSCRPTPSRRWALRTYRCRTLPTRGAPAYGSTLSPHTPITRPWSTAANSASPGWSKRLALLAHSSTSRRTNPRPARSLSAIRAPRASLGRSRQRSMCTVVPPLGVDAARLPSPDHRKADRHAGVDLPLRLLPQPGVVDESLVHLLQGPADRMRGLHVVAEQVHVAPDRDRLAGRSIEVCGHSGHEELRMVPDDDEVAAGPGEARNLAVERSKLGQVLVGQGLRAEIVRLGGQPRGRDIGDTERSVDATAPGHLEHLPREVDAVDGGRRATTLQPYPDPPRPARQIEHRSRPRPVDRPQSLEQTDVHLVLYGLLVRPDPLRIPFPDLDNRVSTLVVERVIHGRHSLTANPRPTLPHADATPSLGSRIFRQRDVHPGQPVRAAAQPLLPYARKRLALVPKAAPEAHRFTRKHPCIALDGRAHHTVLPQLSK